MTHKFKGILFNNIHSNGFIPSNFKMICSYVQWYIQIKFLNSIETIVRSCVFKNFNKKKKKITNIYKRWLKPVIRWE